MPRRENRPTGIRKQMTPELLWIESRIFIGIKNNLIVLSVDKGEELFVLMI